MFPIRRELIAFAACVAGTWVAARAAEPPAIRGVVRDAHGTPQMGVLIELLQNGLSETTYTDLHGKYRLQAVAPGAYDLHATAALFLPTLRHHIVLRGGTTLLNLTMSSLLDTAYWLPREGHLQDGSADDWKWTLRSPTNRPLLRLAGTSTPTLTEGRRVERQVRFEGDQSTGGFGTGTASATATLAESAGTGGTERLLRASLVPAGAAGRTPASEVGARLRSGTAGQMQREVTARYRSLPQVQSGGNGLTVLDVRSAERLLLGDMASVEAGTQSVWLHAGADALVTTPFLRVSSAVPGGWVLRYTVASGAVRPSVEGVGQFEREAPVAALTPDGHLLTERGLRQEIRLRRTTGPVQVHVAYHHDTLSRAVLSGRLVRSEAPAGTALSPDALYGIATDEQSGALRAVVHGFDSDGVALVGELSPWHHGTLSAGYLNGDGLTIVPTSGQNLQWRRRRSQAAFIAMRTERSQHGSNFGVAYRWQPPADLSVIVPDESAEVEAYLSASLHQRIAFLCDSDRGTEAQIVVSGSNLLNEGRHRVLLPVGPVDMASALQQLRAGLEITF